MEVQIPIQISQQLRDPNGFCIKDSITYIHFIKGMLVSNRDFPSEHFGRVYSASMYLPREHGKVRKI